MATSVILAFFVGMLFRDLAIITLAIMARRARENKQNEPRSVEAAVARGENMDEMAKRIVERTTVVELDTMDGMLYLYAKGDGMFLAQASDMESLIEKLRYRFGSDRYYVLDDEIIRT